MTIPKWKRFEELVADIQKDLTQEGFIVTPNDKIRGLDTETDRQIDVSIRGHVGQFNLLMILEAKDYNKPVDVPVLEAFTGLARDVRAHKAGIVSAQGFTKAVKTCAEKASIDLYTVIDTEKHEWQKKLMLPALCDVSLLHSYRLQITTVPDMPFSIMPNAINNRRSMVLPVAISAEAINNPRGIILFDKDQNKLGTIDELLMKTWESGATEFQEGSYEGVEIVPNPVYIEHAEVPGAYCVINLTATMNVSKEYYHGEVSLKEARGLRNEITGRNQIVTNMTVEAIEYAEITKNWQKIESPHQLVVNPIVHIRVIGIN